MALADALDMPAAHLVGHLVCLWLWAVDNAREGQLPSSARVIALAAQWGGDAGAFVEALQAAGFVDADLRIHDYDAYVGKLLLQREANAEKARRWRARQRCAATVTDTYPGTQPLRTAATEQNRTEQNRTTNASALDPASAVPHANEPMAVDVVAPVETVTSASALAPLLVTDEPVDPPAPSPKPRAPLAPAVQVVRTILGFTPDDRQKREIIAAVGEAEDGVALWRRCCVAWKDAGYKPRNLAGILDWYADGGPPPRYAEHAAPGERRAGRAPGPLSSSANGRPLVGAAALFAMSPLSRPPPSEGEFLAEPRQHRRSAP